MSDKEAEALAAIAERLWKTEKAHAHELAETVMNQNPIPPIVAHLDGMAAFLADLQKRSFIHGASAALNFVREQTIGIAIDRETSATQKPN